MPANAVAGSFSVKGTSRSTLPGNSTSAFPASVPKKSAMLRMSRSSSPELYQPRVQEPLCLSSDALQTCGFREQHPGEESVNRDAALRPCKSPARSGVPQPPGVFLFVLQALAVSPTLILANILVMEL
jgi:hypothetical protein